VTLQSFSLLWPGGAQQPRPARRLAQTTANDLDLGEVVRALAGRDKRREAFAWAVLTEVGTDAATIRYRQEVFEDIARDQRLQARLQALLPVLAEVGRREEPAARQEEDWGILEITRRLSDLSLYVRAVQELRAALLEAQPRSAGLRTLLAGLEAEVGTPTFEALERELPPLRQRIQQGECVTIAINLKPSWEPESAAIVSIGPRTQGPSSLVARLLGGTHPEAARAITPLRRTEPVRLYSDDNPLFRDLRALLEATAGPVAAALEAFRAVAADKLVHLEPELAFYLQAAAFFQRLAAAGLPFCRPEVAPPEERSSHVQGAYNLALALRLLADKGTGPRRIVPSDVVFDGRQGRIWILTGPNRGGKTTYIRAVGLIHVLFAAGLPVPGRSARLSPVDMIYTHFLAPETARPGEGRLDEEAERLAEIFAEATPQSLVLLNEVLAGTSQVEALALAVDAVRGLRLLGARCIYATHLHDLAAAADRINESVPGSDSPVASLVAGVLEAGDPPAPEPIWLHRDGPGGVGRGPEGLRPSGSPPSEASDRGPAGAQPPRSQGLPDPAERGEGEPRPTFHIVPGPPRMQSFASAIARQHGISFAQLQQKLRERGILPPGGPGAA
jgi:DNA mismatch repair protein MutS